MNWRNLAPATWLCTLLFCVGSWAQPTIDKIELFAGNPNYAEPKDRAREGQGLRDDPPLAWRNLLFVGDKLVTSVGQEIWYTDLAVANPTLKRVAGRENTGGQSLQGGNGASARFANIFGLDVLPDGTLVGADQTGNGLFLVKDPFGAATVTFVAGSTKPLESVSPGRPPNVGDVDGPGTQARFGLPIWPTVIGTDVFFIDEHHQKLKRMSTDAAYTVKTIAKLPEGMYYAMIALKGKLYAVANNSKSEGFIVEIDPASGAVRDVIRGNSAAFESSGAINISGLATDGKGLFTTHSGQLLYITLDGAVKSITGTGVWFDYRNPYDPTKPQTAQTVQLVTTRRNTTVGSNVSLAHKDNAVYFSARNTTPYVLRLQSK